MISSPIDEIKNRLDIVEVIGSYIKLQKAGQNFRALCPFHSEKTPSFFVSPTRQIWHCFGCQKGGNIFQFVMDIEGIEFGDALRLLAQKAGIELKKQDPKIRSERERLYEICEITTKFFEKQLEESKTGKEAKKYLLERKISEESLKKWRIGYAPNLWQGLSDFLSSRGYSQEEIEKAGLGLSSEKGSFYDRFRGRIIFPIFDLNSKVIGFTGRIFKSQNKDEAAKYVNTPQTLLYDKGRILYGLDKAKVEIRKKDVCILVEGNIDLIMVHQAGFENAVAISGTALTPYQLNILKRYSDNLLIAFDMDAAGQTATKKGIDLAQNQGFNIKIVILSEGKDPAEIISKKPKEWNSVLEKAKSIMDFYFDIAFSGKDLRSPENKKEIAKILLPVIKRIPNKIEQSHWTRELAKRLTVKEEDIEIEMKKVSVVNFISEVAEQQKPISIENTKNRREMLEERILTLILKSPKQIKTLDKKIISFFSDSTQEILINIRKKEYNFKKEELNIFLNRLFLKAEIEEIEEKSILLEVQSCLKEIQLLDIRNKLDKLSKDIKKAEGEKDFKKIKKLTKDFNIFSKSFFDLEIS
jgi:DNA primase